MRNVALDFNIVLMSIERCQVKLASNGCFTQPCFLDFARVLCVCHV